MTDQQSSIWGVGWAALAAKGQFTKLLLQLPSRRLCPDVMAALCCQCSTIAIVADGIGDINSLG